MTLPASHAAAADRYWVNPAGGTFNQSNWSNTSEGSAGASVPGVGDSTYFDLSNAYSITFSGNASGDGVNVDSGTVTFMSNTTSPRIYQVNSGEAFLAVQNNATLNIGAANPVRPVWLNVGNTLYVGFSGSGTGTVIVGGNGSRLDGHGSAHYLGANGRTGTLTYQDGADGTIDGSILLATSSFPTTRGYLNVLSDADLIIGNLYVSSSNSSGAPRGEVTVAGPGSTLTQAGASTLTVGYSSGGIGQILVRDGGVFSTGAGLVTINATGAINVDGGTLNLNGPLANNGGAFNFTAGTLNVPGDFTVGTDGPLGQNVTLASSRALGVAGTVSIDPFRTLTLDGGSLTTGELAVNGTLDFRRGTLGITGAGGLTIGAGGSFGAMVAISSGQQLDVTNTLAVDPDALILISGDGRVQAGIVGNEGEIELAGSQATLAGDVTNDGLLHGHGKVNGTLINLAGGELRANANQRLAFTAAIPNTNAGLVNLQGGTAEFSTSLTNNAGGRITGRGTLITRGGLDNTGEIALSSGISDLVGDVTNAAAGRVTISGNADVTFWDDVNQRGALFRVSAGSSATFFGTLSGAGISGPGSVYIEADITPGFSPGTMSFGGDLAFGPLATLDSEIGGLIPGSQHDQVTIAGDASLDGMLNVDLVNGFLPTIDQSFVLMTYGSHTGEFSSLELPPLPAELTWSLDYGANSLVLSTISGEMLSGDIDLDGDVDRTDAALFTQHLGLTNSAVWTTGDFNADGATTLADLAMLQINFGAVGPMTAGKADPTAAVPEPGMSIAIMVICFPWLLRRRFHKRA